MYVEPENNQIKFVARIYPPLVLPSLTHKVCLLIEKISSFFERGISRVAISRLSTLLQSNSSAHSVDKVAPDMLKFSICFIVLISHVNNSISHREKRFLIFPRVSFSNRLNFQSILNSSISFERHRYQGKSNETSGK